MVLNIYVKLLFSYKGSYYFNYTMICSFILISVLNLKLESFGDKKAVSVMEIRVLTETEFSQHYCVL